ncbi:MAG: anthranilate/aminodeoxychorismate synthase component II [Candidatus Omnitrophica bacterium]|nr:anthranilate/aminodeoxychorismate synthase component II [Candidatus Omnitrophota bacterium]
MIFVIDNYDSFTYNIVQYLGELGQEVIVRRNDRVSVREIKELSPGRLVISPGPGCPADAGVSAEAVKAFENRIPILGVCLGHQTIAEVYGARVVRGSRIMHGKVSPIQHNGEDIFKGLSDPFMATRYHSLIVEPGSLREPLERTAWTEEEEIMALRHKEYPIWGVQFHPESILTEDGKKMLENFLSL